MFRNNIASVIEIATLQNQFALEIMNSAYSLLRGEDFKLKAKLLRKYYEANINGLFLPFTTYRDIHNDIYQCFLKVIGFQEHKNKANKEIEKLEHQVNNNFGFEDL